MASQVTYYNLLGVVLLAFNVAIIVFNSVLIKMIIRLKQNNLFETLLLGLSGIDIFKAVVLFGLSSVTLLQHKQFGQDSVICYISGWSFTTSFLSSAITLGIMAVERCITLLRRGPYAFPCGPLKLKIVLMLSYVAAAFYGLLPLLQFGHIVPSENRLHCHFSFTDRSNQGKAYSVIMLILGWSWNLIIFVCIFVSYNTISSNPRMNNNKATFGREADIKSITEYQNIFGYFESPRSGMWATSTKMKEMDKKLGSEKRTPTVSYWTWKLSNSDYCLEKGYFLVSVGLILSFSVSWIPFLGYLTIAQIQSEDLPKILYMISVCSSVLSSVFNPLISMMLYNPYREEVSEFVERYFPKFIACIRKHKLNKEGTLETPQYFQDLDNSKLPWPNSLSLTFQNCPSPEIWRYGHSTVEKGSEKISRRSSEIRRPSEHGNRSLQHKKSLSCSVIPSDNDSVMEDGKKETFKDDLRYQVLNRTSSSAYVIGLTSTPRKQNRRSTRGSKYSASSECLPDLSYNSYHKFAHMGFQERSVLKKVDIAEIMEAYV